MPQSLTIASFIFGAVLLLISILSGGFKIFGAEVSGKTGTSGRLISGILGIIFILIGFSGLEERKERSGPPEPAPTQSAVAGPSPTPIPILTTSPSPVATPVVSNFVAGPSLPQNYSCPYVQGGFWLQNSNIWYGPFGNGFGIMLAPAGGFMVWDPYLINVYGTYGSVLTYPDPYRTWQRNVWIPLQQSRFSVCVDGTGNVYGYFQY